MTRSVIGIDAELTKRIDALTGKEEIISVAKINPRTGKEEPIYLPKSSRLLGTYIIGGTGQGKSGLLENLIMQDISQQIGVCVLDPHGDLINKVIARLDKKDIDRVILLETKDTEYQGTDYYPGLNIYQCDDPTDDDLVDDTYERIKHLFDVVTLEKSGEEKLGVRVAQGIRSSAITLIDSFPVYGCTMLELDILFGEDTPHAKLVSHVPAIDRAVQKYWKEYEKFDSNEKASRADMVLNKIQGYLISRKLQRIVGQSRTTINFRDVMDCRPGKILLVKLPGDSEEMTELLGKILIAQILGAALSRVNIPLDQRKQFNIYADEFELYATDDFTRLLKECRKYGMAVTIAHQSRDFLDLRNQAASLQVANLIILRITFKDAEKDLAGNFYISPQAAWEEELEEEQLEIREQERLEVMEVIDGEEEIDTPMKNIVHHLINGGAHPNPIVNDYIWKTLEGNERWLYTSNLNQILYNAMTGQPQDTSYPKETFFASLFGVRGGYLSSCLSSSVMNKHTYFAYDTSAAYNSFVQYWLTDDSTYLDEFYTYVKEYIRKTLMAGITHDLEGLRVFPKQELKEYHTGKYGYELFVQPLRLTEKIEYHVHVLEPYPSQETLEKAVEYWKENLALQKSPLPHWYTIDAVRLAQLEWEIRITPEKRTEMGYLDRREYACWTLKPGQEQQFYNPMDLENEVEEVFENQDTDQFEERIAELKDVMQALADEPIYAGSGIRQPRKRQHLLLHPEKTFSHPRVAIVHPQRTYQDVLTQVATELSNLPLYTARVKITADNGTAEHIVKTIAPDRGMSQQALTERIAQIRQHMIDKGYIRSKADIDEEIRQRHERLRQDGKQPPSKTSRKVNL